MKKKNQRKIALVLIITTFAVFGVVKLTGSRRFVAAQTNALPTSTPAEFNQADALAKRPKNGKPRIKTPNKLPAKCRRWSKRSTASF